MLHNSPNYFFYPPPADVKHFSTSFWNSRQNTYKYVYYGISGAEWMRQPEGTGRCQVHFREEIRVHPCGARKAVEVELSVVREGIGGWGPGTRRPEDSRQRTVGRLNYTFFRLFSFPRLRGDDISFG
jgi:hypothetical protein